MKKILLPLGVLATLALIACAPIKEEQCVAGNWEAIGLRDGANGRSSSYIAKIAEECAKYGVGVDQNTWSQGRTQGLKTYCTISNAESVGRKGREMNPVCGSSTVLAAANNHGEKYYALTERLDDYQDEKNDLQAVIRNNFQGELSNEQRRLLRRYLSSLDALNDKIDSLQRRIRLFPSYISTL